MSYKDAELAKDLEASMTRMLELLLLILCPEGNDLVQIRVVLTASKSF